jgi:hypothetical protein
MQRHQRAQAAALQRQAACAEQCVAALAQAVAALVERLDGRRRPQLAQAGQARRHAGHVVVEGAGMAQRIGAARVEALHQLAPATEGA